MTAPVPQTRVYPNGIRLEDGYRSLIACELYPNLAIWEIALTPANRDGQEPVNTTTMWNERFMTKAPRQLVDTGDIVVRVAYDPAVMPIIDALLNVKTTWTKSYPNGDTESIFAFLRVFERGEIVEGTMPEATMTITPTNTDPVTGEEEYPFYEGTSGTGT